MLPGAPATTRLRSPGPQPGGRLPNSLSFSEKAPHTAASSTEWEPEGSPWAPALGRAEALASLGASAVDVLVRATKYKNVDVRRAAVLGLWKTGPAAREARSELQQLLRDEHGGVRRYAELALATIDG